MGQANFSPIPTPSTAQKKHSSVLEHTLADITASLDRSLFAEEIAGREGLLQSLDARVKLAGILVLLLAVGFSHSLWVLAGLYILALALAVLSAIPGSYFIKRVWLFLPFFTGILILPVLFITPGAVLVSLPLGLYITRMGVESALFLLLRVSTSVSLGLLLILTTPWNRVLSALSMLHIPDAFVLILGMTYRYIYVLLRLANDMFQSRKSRVVGRLSGTQERRMMAASAGVLFNHSLNLSSEVFLAMQSRGFTGRVVTLKPFRMSTRDWTWGAGFVLVAVLAIILGR